MNMVLETLEQSWCWRCFHSVLQPPIGMETYVFLFWERLTVFVSLRQENELLTGVIEARTNVLFNI